ncbi:transcriptional regulator, TetR family [Leptospira broomii serovar Hurstbridge str. 5399]|uniref:Transcriptional regulator, TetR family n=1 Tax=Leptospira broomii serovar Hurstbridge str. 5399 TaxID=1049789 RepID=T0GL77_9LEPT|nr:TetR/AcrR family transcriptional regulator [Leptospira broomii]EQA46093.1 transcriptional regulator, TetR family [Leptospira broomii serovar Hurstbridge str. 5399]
MEKNETQLEILRLAANYASLHGLNDLTIGKLATAAGMSKAGLHGSFGSKVDLQMSTIQFAAEIFTREVIQPIAKIDSGYKRVVAFCENWLSYVDRKVFPGGCFFGRISIEGASLPERIDAEIKRLFQTFRQFLKHELKKSKLSPAKSSELSDQLLALVISYNWAVHALNQPSAADHVRSLIFQKLEELKDLDRAQGRK